MVGRRLHGERHLPSPHQRRIARYLRNMKDKKVDVRCPQCDRLLCRVDGVGSKVEIKCRCGCVVEWPDTTKARIVKQS